MQNQRQSQEELEQKLNKIIEKFEYLKTTQLNDPEAVQSLKKDMEILQSKIHYLKEKIQYQRVEPTEKKRYLLSSAYFSNRMENSVSVMTDVQIEMLEQNICELFYKSQKTRGIRWMDKELFFSLMRKMEVLPYMWGNIYEYRQEDWTIGQHSCQRLIAELELFLEAVEALPQKYRFVKHWVYCPKKIEYKMRAYCILAEYFEYYLIS